MDLDTAMYTYRFIPMIALHNRPVSAVVVLLLLAAAGSLPGVIFFSQGHTAVQVSFSNL